MRKIFLFLFITSSINAFAQPLTVDHIMRDPKWMGTSPSNVFWSNDSKTVFFNWNPQKNSSDSLYAYALNTSAPEKANNGIIERNSALNNAGYNLAGTQMVYAFRGDIYWTDIKTNKTIRVTQTEEQENNPSFIMNEEWIVFTKSPNLFAWHTKTGVLMQLTNIGSGGSTTVGNFNRSAAMINSQTQDGWLQQQQLDLFEVLKERKDKREQRANYVRNNRMVYNDTIKRIATGDKMMQGLQISPDARFVTYRLYQAPSGNKATIVPDYVPESGYTTDLNTRTKVGNALGKFDFYVWDRMRDTLMQIKIDTIPGIQDLPDYAKDYPKKYEGKKPSNRSVVIYGPYWNSSATFAIVDIRSQDNKDRWIMQLEAATGKLLPIDRQRDNAWIGGPGIGGGNFGTKIGWINNDQFYFQSETSGYSHLYVYDVKTQNKKALTAGNYEVQDLKLSKNKQHFYLLTNETHPGKLNWYRIKTDGSAKERITAWEGGYEVSMSPDEKWIAYRYSYINKPWELYVQENAPGKKPIQVTNLAMSEEFKKYDWKEAKVTTIPARDGQNIYARIYEPTAAKKNGAAVFFVHGAGYLQNVHYWWSSYFREYMFNNLLVDKGYTVIDIDYRASSGYGRDWRTGIYRHMGGKDLTDHVDAADFLVKNYGIDPNRIGLYGGSYGGFITLMGLFTTPDVFKAGAALRPVTDWAHYNHGYTANILNEPVQDSIAYAKSSPINFAAGLKNHLLICHGMVDVNVHFQDVVRLSQKLIELKKENWELAVYPMEDHGFVEPSSWTDEYKRILKLFEEKLGK
ncbi:MAG: prolyl oligopeptidase family serine peptidase [Sediminibacterium sp.]|nr:prolyl oligopeptidase family serine peptidase [Sediminibacterium sp.]